MLIVAPIPPLGAVARLVLNTSMPVMASEASWAKLKARVPTSTPPIGVWPGAPNASAPGIRRPLRVTVLNCGPKPRAVTCAPSPSRRSMEIPVMRCSDSARLVSGNLPMSSALIASTTPAASRLMPIDWLRLLRIAVTLTASRVVAEALLDCGAGAGGGATSCANAGLTTNRPPTKVNMAFDLKLFNVRRIDVSSGVESKRQRPVSRHAIWRNHGHCPTGRGD